ncbi:VWA domain-containing protein [Streptomyces sp. NPDC048665]|uniref:VWA domain-containing protein n=1 Tax=Streptomyces sp. NPDC048665 TaxID=3155490 RepID=UPI003435F2CC
MVEADIEADADIEPKTTAEAEAGTEPETTAGVGSIAEAEAEADTEPEAEPRNAEPQAADGAEPGPQETAEATPTTDVDPTPEPEAARTEPEAAPEPTTAEAAEPQTATEPTAEPETEPQPTVEQVAQEPTEPETEAEPEATAPAPEATAPTPEAEPEAEPAPVPAAPEANTATPEAEPEPEAAPALVAPEAPAPAPEADETAAPADNAAAAAGEPATVPQAADGEDVPQGPPAVDDESGTGGAGGGTGAEGEAEAPAPVAPEATATAPLPHSLATAHKAAADALATAGLTGTRAKLYLVLDRSASMRPYYKDGSAQALADQTLALAAHLEPEETSVHVVFFSTEVDGTTDLTLTPDHETKIDDVHAGLGRMGRTSYHAAVEAVLAHYDRHNDANDNDAPGTPALVVFQTDGAPDAKTPATQALTAAAGSHPAVFFSFVAFGDHDNKAFDYLRKLKTPNTSFFHAGPAPRELTDTELYDGVLIDWKP